MLGQVSAFLATRWGFATALSAVFIAAISAIFYVEVSTNRIRDVEQQFDDRRFRNSFAAMNDIHELHHLLEATAPGRPLTDEMREAFSWQLAVLRERAAQLGMASRKSGDIDRKAAKIGTQISNLCDLGRAILVAEPGQVDRAIRAFDSSSDALHSAMVAFLYDVRHVENTVVETQSESIVEFRVGVIAILVALACTGAIGLLLLRREIVSGLAREKAEARVHFLAYYDPLTGLPNRVRFQERVGQALNEGTSASLLLLDLDEFKQINDTYGHAVGDQVLVHAASIFAAEAEGVGGFSSRLSGDEFAIFVPTEGPKALGALCDRIINRLSVPFSTGQDRFAVGASLGIASCGQVAATMELSYESMARVADFALYTSKLGGRGRFTFYDTEVEQQFMLRRAMLEELPDAVASGALEVYLQPQFSVGKARICSFEALVRWRRNNEMVPPQAFIQVAEESGLIAAIDFFVLGEATRVVGAWNREHDTDYGVSVNFSASDFGSDHIVAVVRDALASSGLEAGQLTVEVTESVEIHDWDNMQRVLMKLREIGCRISIDDFGKGYSSLAYVRAMAADELKIDRSLLREIEEEDTARFVLDAIVDLGTKFAMDIVAEGVETQNQARIVEALGIGLIQGYLIGPPVPAAEALLGAAAYPSEVATPVGAPAVRVLTAEDPAEQPLPSDFEALHPASERESRARQAGGG